MLLVVLFVVVVVNFTFGSVRRCLRQGRRRSSCVGNGGVLYVVPVIAGKYPTFSPNNPLMEVPVHETNNDNCEKDAFWLSTKAGCRTRSV